MKRRVCTKEEFDAFLDAYPRKLVRDVTQICEPPLVTYNDFTLGNWPEMVVAAHSFSDQLGTKPSDWEIADTSSDAVGTEDK